MALSVGSLCGSAWKAEGVGRFGQVSVSPVRPGCRRAGCRLGRWRGQPIKACSLEGGETAEGDDAGGAKPSPASWLQLESRADSYGGWSADENRSNGDMFAGWLKIGGALFLAIGISLGARSLYSRKDVANEFAVSVPAKEQIVSPVDKPDLSVTHQSMDNGELVSEVNQKMQKQEGESSMEDFTSELQHEETVTTAAAEAMVGRVLVPAPVDHMQEQALAALQALKVIEVGVKPDAICTRREYARWLIASSGLLTRSPAHRVFPAMYIENVTELAFDDVLPEDPDFPFIQGLAEAGLISSELTKCDKLDRIGNGDLQGSKKSIFLPDSPLSRQDLISWKLAMERHTISTVTKETLLEKSGFIDTDRIHQDAWPFLLVDLFSGERSIVALAFGYTRRFQPHKPVTKGQAAIALSTGEAAELVSEELARLEAESIAEAAVAAELALETKAQQEAVAMFNQLLEEEKAKREAAEKLVEMTFIELEKLKADREEEKYSILRERTSLESERELYFRLRHDVDDQVQVLSNDKLEVAFQRERAKILGVEAEAERETIANMQSELEVEKKALMLARSWAEEEARKAHTHAKVLEEARKRWESQGVHVQVHKELDETNIPALSWRYGGDFQEQKSPVNELLAVTRNVRGRLEDSVARVFYLVEITFSQFRHTVIESLLEMGKKGGEVMFNATSAIAKKTHSIQQSIHLSVTSISSGVSEGTRRFADGFKGEAEKLAQKFKIT